MSEARAITIEGPIGERWAAPGERWADPKAIIKQVHASVGARELIVRIDSPGGSCFASERIYRALRSFPGRVRCVAGRQVASAAVLCFLAVAERVARSTTKFVLHEAATDAGGANWRWTSARHATAAESLARSNRRVVREYAERTNLSREQLRELRAKDTRFDGRQAVKYGFATSLASP